MARKMANIRFWPAPTGIAKPQSALTESTMVQVTTQNGSTEPKTSGARTNAAMVNQS
jgi:hypothetical protein